MQPISSDQLDGKLGTLLPCGLHQMYELIRCQTLRHFCQTAGSLRDAI